MDGRMGRTMGRWIMDIWTSGWSDGEREKDWEMDGWMDGRTEGRAWLTWNLPDISASAVKCPNLTVLQRHEFMYYSFA